MYSDKILNACKEENKLQLLIDDSCEMACIRLNGVAIWFGNFWDFRPGCCYGGTEEFESITGWGGGNPSALMNAVVIFLKHKNIAVDVLPRGAYKFES